MRRLVVPRPRGTAPAFFALVTAQLCLAIPAAAQQVEITPFVGWRAFGELQDYTGAQVDAEDAMSFGGMLTFTPRPDIGVEFGFSRQDTQVLLSAPFLGIDRFDVNIDQWTLGGRRTIIRPNSNVLPFGSGFLGLSSMSSSDGDESITKFMLGLGLGARVMNPTRRFGLRLETRAYFAFAGDGGASVGCGTGGCAFGYWGQSFFQMDFLGGITVGLGEQR